MGRAVERDTEACRRSAQAIAAWRMQDEPLSREALAARVGTSVSTVVRWEHPRMSNPRFSEILAMESLRPGLVRAMFQDNEIFFVVPVKTVSEANTRSHWAEKAKRTKSLREAGKFHTLAAVARRFGANNTPAKMLEEWLAVEITLTRVAPGTLDDDNCASALKGFRDGVADAFNVDDRHPSIAWKYSQKRGKSYAIEVTLTWTNKVASTLPAA